MPIVLLDERDKAELQKQIDTAAAKAAVKANILEKRITNLEQGILPSPFETDSRVAYQKAVPSNALPYAEVEKIGGMTRKCANLIPFPYHFGSSVVINGVTFTANSDGSITANGTSTDVSHLELGNVTFAPNTNYIMTGAVKGRYDLYLRNPYTPSLEPFSFDTEITTTVIIYIDANITFANEKIYPMLNQGSTALPYEPFFEGLRSAPVEKVESVGANLFDFAEKTTTASGYIFRGLFLPQRIKAGTYTFSFRAKNYTPTNQFQCTFLNSKGVIIADSQGVFLNEICIFTFTITEEAVVAELYVNSTIGGTFYDFMLNKGETALPYTPYREPSILPIPSAVQALEGYGEGVNESVYNYIDWEKKQFVQRVGKVDLGTLNWDWYEPGFFAVNMNNYPALNKAGGSNYISDTYRKISDRTDAEMANAADLTICSNHGGQGSWVNIKDTKYGTDYNAFKAGVSGSMLYYELAEPIITDISDILSEDNFIGVEGGGTVTFKNEYEYAVPSEITYRVKGDA